MGNCGCSRQQCLYSELVSPSVNRSTETGVYRHPSHHARLPDKLSSPMGPVDSLHAAFFAAAECYPSAQCLAKGPGEWMSYQQVSNQVLEMGRGLVRLSLATKNEIPVVGIAGDNSAELLMADLAIMSQGLASVMLPSDEDYLDQLFKQTQLSTLLLSGAPPNYLLTTRPTSLNTIVALSPLGGIATRKLTQCGFKVLTMENLLMAGRHSSVRVNLMPSSIATVVYGSQGGALLSHANLVAAMGSLLDSDWNPGQEDSLLCYLPLSDAPHRWFVYSVLLRGGHVSFHSDMDSLDDELMVSQPSLLVACPFLLNHLYHLIQHQFASQTGLNQVLLTKALQAKQDNLQTLGTVLHPVYDQVIFKKIKDMLGGRVRMVLSVGPVHKDVLSFLMVTTMSLILEGIAMAEAGGLLTIGRASAPGPGHQGGAARCIEFKVREPSGLTQTMPKGELVIRGPSVFQGYWGGPRRKNTEWFSTGLLVRVDSSQGAVTYVDKQDQLICLGSATPLAPVPMENAFRLLPSILEICLLADDKQSSPVAVIYPYEEALRDTAREAGVDEMTKSFSQVLSCAKVKSALLTEMAQQATDHELPPQWVPTKVLLLNQPFSQLRCLQADYQVDRKALARRLHKEIARLKA